MLESTPGTIRTEQWWYTLYLNETRGATVGPCQHKLKVIITSTLCSMHYLTQGMTKVLLILQFHSCWCQAYLLNIILSYLAYYLHFDRSDKVKISFKTWLSQISSAVHIRSEPFPSYIYYLFNLSSWQNNETCCEHMIYESSIFDTLS